MTKHGHSRKAWKSPTYKSWHAMMKRCHQTGATEYRLYGGRGINVCERWQDFRNFLADMGERPTGHSLDRIDPDGHYEPGNCRWATNLEQQNNKRNNTVLTAGGRTMTIQDWHRETGIGSSTIRERLRRGWSTEDAVSKRPLFMGGAIHKARLAAVAP